MSGLPVTIVDACLRDGTGGSPTAVVGETALSDAARRAVPVLAGTSHAVFVAEDGPAVRLRFFTSGGELPACGHGTVAALALLAERAATAGAEPALLAPDRVFAARWVRRGPFADAEFDPGEVALRASTGPEPEQVLAALGLAADALPAPVCAASLGRWRLLVPVADRAALSALAPDAGRLRAACDRLGLLGCYVYTPPDRQGRLAARMFAPSIGVPEDIANANSTACLAAHLAQAAARPVRIAADMGDSLGRPATVTAHATGRAVRVGGAARVGPVLHLDVPR
ncbi:PhzF family phenazine biosynthesis protein [Catellatospora bangladeshensis]|uniref:PhzF family phenazine biosynthesis protein n=2 Tax=Catellatospora bangladeshensis TaxID=310355 RepID=A0A8J3JKR4_9ACTN|nr:PhzF family phenazine biosynthesis protein [Catellatospora bangladeshensis]GIF82312.1 hypothetical protein Cba03nite_36610 [Catellatospora bangladeshensis]